MDIMTRKASSWYHRRRLDEAEKKHARIMKEFTVDLANHTQEFIVADAAKGQKLYWQDWLWKTYKKVEAAEPQKRTCVCRDCEVKLDRPEEHG